MKRTHKRILGIFGLVFVAVTTVFAASLPGPEAKATTSVTDTISVRVVGSQPNVTLKSPDPSVEDAIYTSAEQLVKVEYENIEYITVKLIYTDIDGVEHEYLLDDSEFVDYDAGEFSVTVNLSGENYGYGEYELVVEGIGYGGISDVDRFNFSYYPVAATLRKDEDSGLVYVDLDYDTESEDGEVEKILINVYDENGNLVTAISPIEVTAPNKSVEIPFADNNLSSGKYTITVTAYDSEGTLLYKPYTLPAYEHTATPAPNTGAFFRDLNISRADYLITGLIAFFAFGIFGFVFIAKKQKKTSRRR